MMVPNPTSLRQHHLRVHPVLCAFALFAALGSLARVVEEPYPAQITPPADLPDLPATLVVDDSVLTAAPDANFIMNSPNVHELRLKHGHLHRRQKDDDEGEDRETTKIVKNQEVSRTESEDHEGTKTKDGHGDKTHTADDEKETRSASDDNSGTKETRTVAPTQTLTEDPDELATRSLSIAPSSTATQSADPDAPLPVPFDGTATSEFKTDGGDNSCPDFISSLLNSDKFSNCYPISMLILKSDSFFNAKKQITSMVRVLDAGCAADVDSCSEFMDSAAQNLTAKENCQEEYNQGLTVVTEAYNGLVNYKTMYSATCLQDPDSDQYCYASAVTNSTDSSDSYIYFLPYNLALPGSSTPSCDWCNKETMDIFHAASADRDLLISKTYEEAARQINNLCDPEYVNGTLPEAVESHGPAMLPSWVGTVGTACLAGVLGSLL